MVLSIVLNEKIPANILVSFYYIDNPTIEKLREHKETTRFLLDSGAFSAWKKGKTIEVDDYCRFIEKLTPIIEPWRYFTLDVVGDPVKTQENYEIMLKRGFKPIPIFTRGENISSIDDYYKNSDVVGIGSLVQTKKNRQFVNAVMKKIGKRKAHWLGFTQINYLKHYKPYMCDTSAVNSAFRYARLGLYVGNGKFLSCGKSDFLKKPNTTITRIFKELEIDPKIFSKSENWINTGKPRNLENTTFRSYVKYQLEIEKNLGTKLFIACSGLWQVSLALSAHSFWDKRGINVRR